MNETLFNAIEEKQNLPKIILFFIFAVILCLLSDISSDTALYVPSKLIIVSLLCLSFIIPCRWGLILFMLILIAGTDISQGASEAQEFGAITKASIWNLHIGPIRPSWIIAISVAIHIIKTGSIKLDSSVKTLIVFFSSVPFVTTLIYGDLSFDPIGRLELINDIKVAGILLLSVILFRSFFHRDSRNLILLISCFMGCLLARHMVDFLYWVIGYGSIFSGVVRISVDSAKGGVVFLLLYAVYLVVSRGKLITGGFLGLISSLLLITYSTRALWVTAIAGMFIIAVIVGLKKAAIVVPVLIILAICGFVVLNAVTPDTAFVVSKKAESFQKGLQAENFMQGLDPLRYGSIVNSINDSFKRAGFILGNGYGSYYTDKTVPFPVELTDAFPTYSGTTGRFYRVHDFGFHMFFKYGIVGLALLLWLYLSPVWKAYKILRFYPHAYAGTMVCFLGFIITVILQLYWSGKGLFISGFVVAILMAFNDEYVKCHTQYDDDSIKSNVSDTESVLEWA